MYTFDQLKEDVRKEAEALKVHAGEKKLTRLNFEQLDASDTNLCIYGQMTGDCHSPVAAQLIAKCTRRFFGHEMFSQLGGKGIEGLESVEVLNSIEDFIKHRTEKRAFYYSAIEAYILLPEARNANLIAFLKGESETLEL